MGRVTVLASCVLIALSASVVAAPRAAVLAVDLSGGAPEYVRAKAGSRVQDGLAAAGYDVMPKDQVTAKLAGELASCRSGSCLAKGGKALDVTSLVLVTVTRKDESTIIVMRLLDPASGDVIAEVHEVCDLCGQQELEARIRVAASALRRKAETERAKRDAVAHVEVPHVPPAPA